MPNPSFEPTRSGKPLQAFISFSTSRALPPRAAQLKRWASRAARQPNPLGAPA